MSALVPLTLHIFAHASGPEMAQALQARPGFRPVVHATLDGLLSAIAAGPAGVVIFEAAGSTDIAAALALIGERSSDTAGIILGENLPIGAVRSLLLLHRWDILELPTTLDQLCAAIVRVSAKPGTGQPVSPPRQGQCWTFASPVGGGGATLLAVEMAHQVSQLPGKPRTCLIDLNFFDGGCAAYLNCEPNLMVSALATAPERIDSQLLQALTTRHACGLDLLAAPRTPDLSGLPSHAATVRMLEVACESYDHVIVDLPRWPMPWTRDVVTGTDETFLITELTVPALNAARNWISDYSREALPGMSAIKPILNRRPKSLFSGSVTVEQAERAIQQPVFGSVHSDWPAALAAVNLGQPVSLAKPNSVIVKDVAQWLEKLIGSGQRRTAKTRKVA